MTLKQPASVAYERYREVRRDMLIAHCMVFRLTQPSARHIVGISTEPAGPGERSEDLVYLDGADWDEETAANAARLQREHRIFVNVHRHETTDSEYPVRPAAATVLHSAKGRERNLPCPCGSGKKRKKCHG
jgi:preprotein translocase subunit SecA